MSHPRHSIPCQHRSSSQFLRPLVSGVATSGGAHIVITTSRYSCATVEYFQGISQRFGSKGYALAVVSPIQGSKQGAEVLVDYVYSTLSHQLNYIAFAAVPGDGHEINGIDDKPELRTASC